MWPSKLVPGWTYVSIGYPREYWIIYRGPDFLRSYDLAPRHPLPPSTVGNVSLSVILCVAGRAYWREEGGRGLAKRQIIRPWESLSLYKSFNTLRVRVTLYNFNMISSVEQLQAEPLWLWMSFNGSRVSFHGCYKAVSLTKLQLTA